MKVEELSQYGKTLTGLPKEALKKQKTIVMKDVHEADIEMNRAANFLKKYK